MKINSEQVSMILNMLIGSDLNFICQHSQTQPKVMAKFVDHLKMTVINFIDKQIDEDLPLPDKVSRMQFLYQELWSMCNDYKCACAVRFMDNKPSQIIQPKPGEVIQLNAGGKKNDR